MKRLGLLREFEASLAEALGGSAADREDVEAMLQTNRFGYFNSRNTVQSALSLLANGYYDEAVETLEECMRADASILRGWESHCEEKGLDPRKVSPLSPASTADDLKAYYRRAREYNEQVPS
jgi:hypothetical protein